MFFLLISSCCNASLATVVKQWFGWHLVQTSKTCFGTLCKERACSVEVWKVYDSKSKEAQNLGVKDHFELNFENLPICKILCANASVSICPGGVKQDCLLGRGRCSSCCFDRKRPKGRAGSRDVFLIVFLHFEAYEAYPNHTKCRLHCPKCRCFVKIRLLLPVLWGTC